MDSFLGECVIPMSESATYRGGNVNRRFGLTARGKKTEKKEGYIWLKVLHTSDLNRVWFLVQTLLKQKMYNELCTYMYTIHFTFFKISIYLLLWNICSIVIFLVTFSFCFHSVFQFWNRPIICLHSNTGTSKPKTFPLRRLNCQQLI